MQLQVGSSHIAGETIRTPYEIILVDCPDEVGLIHRITGVLASQQFNIESNQEFVDVTTSHFFFRAEVSLKTSCSIESLAQLKNALTHILPERANVRIVSRELRPVVICATQEPHCLGELLLLDAVGELPGRIVAVISNHNTLRKLVERFDVPFHFVPHDKLSREQHEQHVAQFSSIWVLASCQAGDPPFLHAALQRQILQYPVQFYLASPCLTLDAVLLGHETK